MSEVQNSTFSMMLIHLARHGRRSFPFQKPRRKNASIFGLIFSWFKEQFKTISFLIPKPISKSKSKDCGETTAKNQTNHLQQASSFFLGTPFNVLPSSISFLILSSILRVASFLAGSSEGPEPITIKMKNLCSYCILP